jgi:hypothetical protein
MKSVVFFKAVHMSRKLERLVVLSAVLALLLNEMLHGRASCIQAQHHALVVVPGSMPACYALHKSGTCM